MADVTHYDFEGGTDSAALTTANTGATQVNAPSGGTATFSSAAAQNGSLGGAFMGTAGNFSFARLPAATSSKVMAVAINFEVLAIPTATASFAAIRYTSGNIVRFRVRADGTCDMAEPNGSNAVNISSVTAGGKFRVEALFDVDAGSYSVNLYSENHTTPLNASPVTGTGYNLGSSAIEAIDAGLVSTSHTSSYTVYVDDVRMQANATSEIGPVPSGTPAQDTVHPSSVVDNSGGFTNVGGAADIPTALGDGNDSTYAQSPDSPNGASLTLGHPELAEGDVTVKARHSASAASPAISRKYELLDGTTVIATRTVTLPATATDWQFTTSSSETANITDYTNLRVRVTDTTA